jgi:hypothetical protein
MANKISKRKTFFKKGWHPQPIHGQPDAAFSVLHLKSLSFSEQYNYDYKESTAPP